MLNRGEEAESIAPLKCAAEAMDSVIRQAHRSLQKTSSGQGAKGHRVGPELVE